MAEPAEPQTGSDRPESHVIHELAPDHRDWPEYVAVINEEGQARWVFDAHFESFPRHFVMARQNGRVVGFLMYVVWDIGPNDRGQRALMVDGGTAGRPAGGLRSLRRVLLRFALSGRGSFRSIACGQMACICQVRRRRARALPPRLNSFTSSASGRVG